MGIVLSKKFWISLVVGLVLVAIAFAFVRMYQKDVWALQNFSVMYQEYDKAVADYARTPQADFEDEASDALANLRTSASFRLSSLIKHDGELMAVMQQIAGLAQKEFDSLKAKNPDAATWTNERQATYAHFEELAR